VAEPVIKSCPLCGGPLEVKAYSSGRGFRFDCYGDPSKRCRVRIYVDDYRRKVQPDLPVASRLSSKDAAKKLLERATALEKGGKH